MKFRETFFTVVLFSVLGLTWSFTEDRSSVQPFVRQLTATIQDNKVMLQWVDAQDGKGPVYIYRKIISSGSSGPQDLDPVQVPRGVQSYIDPIVIEK